MQLTLSVESKPIHSFASFVNPAWHLKNHWWNIFYIFKTQSWNTMMYFWCDNFPAASIPWNLFHNFTELNRNIFKSKTSCRMWGHSRDKVNVHCSKGSCDLSSCVTPTRSCDSLQFWTRHHNVFIFLLCVSSNWNFSTDNPWDS